jgi:hypothetical protein
VNTSISLLRRIKDATVDPTFKIADVLRLCKILADRLNPPSAPPGVTIGNFGFFHTLKDDFYTKL